MGFSSMIYISLGLDGKNGDAVVPMLANGILIESASKNYEHFRKYKVIIPIGPNMVDGELNLAVYLSSKDFYMLYYIDLQIGNLWTKKPPLRQAFV